jgi:hypothetical protein
MGLWIWALIENALKVNSLCNIAVKPLRSDLRILDLADG